jgi:hypothetical protein
MFSRVALPHCGYAQAFPKVIHRLRTILSTAGRAGKPTHDYDGGDAALDIAAPFGAAQKLFLAWVRNRRGLNPVVRLRSTCSR